MKTFVATLGIILGLSTTAAMSQAVLVDRITPIGSFPLQCLLKSCWTETMDCDASWRSRLWSTCYCRKRYGPDPVNYEEGYVICAPRRR
jgi:hypothetical protein